MPKPMWRDSSRRMRRHTSPRTGSTAASAIILNIDTAKVSATSWSAMVLMYQRGSVRMVSKRNALVLRHGVVQAAEAGLDVALEHLVVPRLVHDLGGLEELLVGARHDVHELAAREHRALLAVDEHG